MSEKKPLRRPGSKPPTIEEEAAAMAETSKHADCSDDFSEDVGYKPELNGRSAPLRYSRSRSRFISVAVGIFGTCDDVLENAGPVGIWLWVIAAVGQILVALVIAQFAARILLSGSRGWPTQRSAGGWGA